MTSDKDFPFPLGQYTPSIVGKILVTNLGRTRVLMLI